MNKILKYIHCGLAVLLIIISVSLLFGEGPIMVNRYLFIALSLVLAANAWAYATEE